ncbi:type II toxin-antitoxin system RelE/ParE family toxin [Algoriphagus yeomjeoni]|uniref:mRNA-degrading endonuclease RelE of RelBE toxin-antitoxin system n=1 Tax=Algoriphagus yeomjeoni TaxID=291403 RepID=A0A327PWG4_9BACT|nr:type II toxin-antitoxin system RelE/ParE family toxin [Algoriphagus yeomjeoni]RAI95302.1 mRNA-degrading endonuclease RelE of RelBE toxin-antitoxin system [Algoriphagus yeomjeoni]
MTYKVKSVPEFEKELKKLLKKYHSLRSEYIRLIEKLETNPSEGTLLFKNCYKIRLSIASKGKGKSGGARVITNFAISDDMVYLLSIYDKSDQENITDSYIKSLLKDLDQ